MLDIKNIQTFYGKIQALRDVSIKVNYRRNSFTYWS